MSTRPAFKSLTLLALLTFTAGTLTVIVLWRDGRIKRWLQAEVVALYLKKVQPHLPFQIEEADAEATWHELWEGRISRLSLVTRWGAWRIRLSGPINITRPSHSSPFYTVKFTPVGTIEPVRSFGTAAIADRSTPLDLDLFVRASAELNRLDDMEVYAHSAVFDWPYFGIRSKAPDLAAEWHEGIAEVGFSIQSLDWKPSKNHTIHLDKFSSSVETRLALKPFSIGPEVSFDGEAQHLETLWGETYLDLSLLELPIRGELTLAKESPGTLKPEKGVINLGRTPRDRGHNSAPLHLEAVRLGETLNLKWKTQALPIRELLKAALAATGNGTGPFEALTWLNDYDLRTGKIQTEGDATLPLAKTTLLRSRAEGVVRLENVAVQIRKARFAAKGLTLELPFSSRHGVQGVLSVKDLYFRKFHGQLAPTDIALEALGANVFADEGFQFRAGTAGQRGTAETGATLPLTIDAIPLQIGVVSGKIKAGTLPYQFETSLKLAPTPLVQLTWPLCLYGVRLPPATVEAELSPLSVSQGDFDPTGQVVFKLFGGKIRIGEMGLFDLFEEVPEVDFNLDFDGIQLEQLGDWLGFGSMVGSLQGYAHDVTFQKFLPTHFDFSFDAIPEKHWIEFSPEAMKNLVSLFAGGAVEKIPGIGSEAFFGGLSRRLGGYDIKYAGLSLFANDGTILLETHDLPDVYYIMKKHYIFWGHRFKMPIESDHYPVVMDENGLTRVVRSLAAQIQEMSRRKREKEPAHELENDPTCYPPAF